MIDVPAEAYKSYAQGEISAEELVELEKMAATLSTTATNPLYGEVARGLASGAAATGGGIAAALAGHSIAKAVAAARDRLSFRKDLNNILEVYPEIAEQHGDRDISLAYQSIRTLNPTFAKDPLVGGTLLGQILRNRDVHDPKKAPRFEPGVAKDLITAERKGRDSTGKDIASILGGGFETGLKEYSSAAAERRRREYEASRNP